MPAFMVSYDIDTTADDTFADHYEELYQALVDVDSSASFVVESTCLLTCRKRAPRPLWLQIRRNLVFRMAERGAPGSYIRLFLRDGLRLATVLVERPLNRHVHLTPNIEPELVQSALDE